MPWNIYLRTLPLCQPRIPFPKSIEIDWISTEATVYREFALAKVRIDATTGPVKWHRKKKWNDHAAEIGAYFGETNVGRQGVACDINHFHIFIRISTFESIGFDVSRFFITTIVGISMRFNDAFCFACLFHFSLSLVFFSSSARMKWFPIETVWFAHTHKT